MVLFVFEVNIITEKISFKHLKTKIFWIKVQILGGRYGGFFHFSKLLEKTCFFRDGFFRKKPWKFPEKTLEKTAFGKNLPTLLATNVAVRVYSVVNIVYLILMS